MELSSCGFDAAEKRVNKTPARDLLSDLARPALSPPFRLSAHIQLFIYNIIGSFRAGLLN